MDRKPEILLRSHQEDIVKDLETAPSRVCIWAPTGAGKTEIAVYLAAREAEKGGHTLFIVERKTLCSQAVMRFERYGLKTSILRAEDTRLVGGDVTVASIQTLSSRRGRDYVVEILDKSTLIIVDEAHIIYKHHKEILGGIGGGKRVVGMTATPLRQGMGLIFDGLVKCKSYRWLIENGYLVPAMYYIPDSRDVEEGLKRMEVSQTGDYKQDALSRLMSGKAIVGDTISLWKKFGEARQTIVFCVDIDHSKFVAEKFNEEGIPASHIDCFTCEEERSEAFCKFRSGDIRVLCSVGVLSTGFDEPNVECIILARPTLSTILHIQQVGRGLRPYPGKKDCIVIDQALNVQRHGFVEDFEPKEDLSKIEKTDDYKKKRDKKAKKLIICPKCNLAHSSPPKDGLCAGCGHIIIERKPKLEIITGVTKFSVASDATPIPLRNTVYHNNPKRSDIKRAYLMALWEVRRKGWKDGAAFYMALEFLGMSSKEANISWKWKYLEPIEPDMAFNRFLQYKRIARANRKRKYY